MRRRGTGEERGGDSRGESGAPVAQVPQPPVYMGSTEFCLWGQQSSHWDHPPVIDTHLCKHSTDMYGPHRVTLSLANTRTPTKASCRQVFKRTHASPFRRYMLLEAHVCVVGHGDTCMHIHTHGMWPFTHIHEVSNPCGHTHFVLVHEYTDPRGGDS